MIRRSVTYQFVCSMAIGATLLGCALPAPLGLSAEVSPSPTAQQIAAVAAPSAPLLLPAPTVLPTQVVPTSTAYPSPSPWPTERPTAAALASATPLPSATPFTAESRELLFLDVWRKVNENYLYADFRGLDWEAVRNEYAPRIRAAQSTAEFYALLTEMVALLSDNHSRFLAPSDVAIQDALSAGREAAVGIGAVILPRSDGGLVVQVFANGPAERAGIRPRDRIIAVDGQPYAVTPHEIQGPEGSLVRLTVQSPGEPARDVELLRRAVDGKIGPSWRRFHGDIGYLGVSTLWVSDMDEQVRAALLELQAAGPLNGMILDLRGNPGGWRDVLVALLGHFVEGQVGSFFDRRGTTPLLISPVTPFLSDVPLVVLIDGRTASYAELIAAVLQQRGAAVIGTASAGNLETIYAYELAGGSRLWVAQEGFLLDNGENLEGRGVQPNILVEIDWTLFSEDDDPFILEALRVFGTGPK